MGVSSEIDRRVSTYYTCVDLEVKKINSYAQLSLICLNNITPLAGCSNFPFACKIPLRLGQVDRFAD